MSFFARRVLGRTAGRATPYGRIYTVAQLLYRRGRRGWAALTAKERSEFVRIMRDSRGRPGAVAAHDREELRRLVGKMWAEARRLRW